MGKQRPIPFTLFRRSGTGNWSVRFSLNGRQIRASLGTPDEMAATAKAWTLWGEANYKAQNGISVVKKTLAEVADEFITYFEGRVRRGEKSNHQLRDFPPVIRRYLVGFFGDKPIDTIRKADLVRFIEWRKEYWVSGPGKDIERIHYVRNGKSLSRKVEHTIPSVSRLKAELVIVKAVFDQAHDWEYIQRLEMPKLSVKQSAGQNRRPSFTPQEFEKLLNTSLERMLPHNLTGKGKMVVADDGKTERHERQNGHVLRDRARLHHFIEFMAASGLRPPEAKNLNWGDVSGWRDVRTKPLKDQSVVLEVHGKGKRGKAIPKFGAITALHGLWDLFKAEAGREPEDTDPVFADHNGNRIASFKNGFNELLVAAGLKTNNEGKARTTYSLRHFYISERLADGTDIYAIKTNTRTSIKMIENFYGQVDARRFSDQLADKNL